jgi:hypothetical protein
MPQGGSLVLRPGISVTPRVGGSPSKNDIHCGSPAKRRGFDNARGSESARAWTVAAVSAREFSPQPGLQTSID